MKKLIWIVLLFFPFVLHSGDDSWVQIGDMQVHRSNVSSMPGPDGAVKLDVELWEDGILPFEFDFEITPYQKDLFLEACHEWESVANIRCVEGEYKDRKITVSDSSFWGCYAIWGMGSSFVFLKRQMNLANNCWKKPIIMHEIGHALGLIHEHQRMDRDQYVVIQTENLASGFLWLNEKVNFGNQDSTPFTPYDFLSIMHYPRRAFSKNGFDTIVAQPGYEQYQDVMGHVVELSEGDALSAARLYGVRQ